MMRKLLLLALLAPLPVTAKDCTSKEQMLLKVEYSGQTEMVDQAKAAAEKAQAEVTATVKAAKMKPLVLKSSRLTLEPGEGGMRYKGLSSYVLPSSLQAKDLMAKLTEKQLSPSIAITTANRCEKED